VGVVAVSEIEVLVPTTGGVVSVTVTLKSSLTGSPLLRVASQWTVEVSTGNTDVTLKSPDPPPDVLPPLHVAGIGSPVSGSYALML
jgi:hypothetical protein